MVTKEIRVSKFNQTCVLFYIFASERIDERYKNWKKNQPSRRRAMKDIYSDTKILGEVMNYHKKQKESWSYASFIPYGLENELRELGMNKHEIYCGADPSLYFFVCQIKLDKSSLPT